MGLSISQKITSIEVTINNLPDEVFFGNDDYKGIYEFIIKQRRDRLHKHYIKTHLKPAYAKGK